MGVLVGLVVGAALVFWGALGSYIGGRILLPEIGLTPPGYWTWWCYILIMAVFYIPIYAIKEFTKD